jgi:type 1 glutamine amidotransferase
MDKKRFFLFNTWSDEAQARPDCCDVVPVLFEGEINKNTIQDLLDDLRADVGCTHEGVCVYWHAFNKYTKHTLKNNDGKWVSGNCS